MELLEKGGEISICGIYRINHKTRAWSTNPRDISVISYRLSGSSVFRQGDKTLDVECGDILYVPAHVTYSQKSTCDHLIAVHFTARGIYDSELMKLSGAYADVFLKLYDAWTEGSAEGRYRAQSLFAGLLSDLSRSWVGNRDARVTAAIQFMRKNYMDPTVTIAQIADAAGTSEVFLRRIMKKEIGESPLHYLNSLRIAVSKELLAGGYDSIENIARKSGFSDGKYFAEAFHRATGMTASAYRRGKTG